MKSEAKEEGERERGFGREGWGEREGGREGVSSRASTVSVCDLEGEKG